MNCLLKLDYIKRMNFCPLKDNIETEKSTTTQIAIKELFKNTQRILINLKESFKNIKNMPNPEHFVYKGMEWRTST